MKLLSSGYKVILLLLIFSSMVECKSKQTANMDVLTVESLDLERYMGTWYEIARYDHSFERGLVGVTATYSLRSDGKITVINQGYSKTLNGKLKRARGKAKQPDPGNPGKLKVSFFLFFYADYFVLELDKEYRWAVIGSSSDNYLWILSRTPVMDKELINNILKKIENRGYDTDRLIWVRQK